MDWSTSFALSDSIRESLRRRRRRTTTTSTEREKEAEQEREIKTQREREDGFSSQVFVDSINGNKAPEDSMEPTNSSSSRRRSNIEREKERETEREEEEEPTNRSSRRRRRRSNKEKETEREEERETESEEKEKEEEEPTNSSSSSSRRRSSGSKEREKEGDEERETERGRDTEDGFSSQVVVGSINGSNNKNSYEMVKLPPPRLDMGFYVCDALDLAPRLLGKLLRREQVVLRITEVEAYRPNDSACHGRFGITPRTAPVFGPAGHAYVYLCYGLHSMLNVVADKEGVGAAVLVRSCEPVAGLKIIKKRRGQATDKPVLLTGPGKVGQALALTTSWSNHPLYTPGGLEILDAPTPDKILVGPRVGIDYASPEDVAAPWRFAISGTPWVSTPRNTLRPQS